MLPKIMIRFFPIVATLAITLVPMPLFAAEDFYDHAREGWYWYQDPPPEKEKKEDSEETPPQAQSTPDPWQMTAEEFKKHMDEVRNLAVVFPTEENVYELLKLEEVARKKSLAFTAVRTLMLQKHPELSVDSESPMPGPGLRAARYDRKAEQEAVIESASQDFAIVYLGENQCALCNAHEKTLDMFEERHPGWEVRRLTAGQYPALIENAGVTSIPFTLLVNKEGKHMPLGAGAMTITGLKETLYKSIRYMRGEVAPEQYLLKDYQTGGPRDPLAR